MEQHTDKKTKAAFDQTICFTCFETWVDIIKEIETQKGADAALDAFLVLADYCLYGTEPDPETNPWGVFWILAKRQAKNSINNRRRGFGVTNEEQTADIEKYYDENPDATYQAIAAAVGCSVGKVYKIVKPLREALLTDSVGAGSCDSGNDIHSYSSRESCFTPAVKKTEVEHE